MRRLALGLAVAGMTACATAPRPRAGLLATDKNPKAVVSGIVVDSETGRPVAGIEVFGLPRGGDVPWGPPATTDSEGRFTLRLGAPGDYSFLLRFQGISILTPQSADPGYVDVATAPGGRIEGVRLTFLRGEFEKSVP